jgi:hypothetical protein
MKTKLTILLAALALAGCSTYRGGTGPGYDTTYGSDNYPPTDFGRGGNRANPPPYDTESGAFLPETDNMDLHGMESGKFPPPVPPTQR